MSLNLFKTSNEILPKTALTSSEVISFDTPNKLNWSNKEILSRIPPAEFLAIVHALAMLKQRGDSQTVVYSDSRNAMLWVRQKKCKTTLRHTPQFAQAHDMIARAEKWLNENAVANRVVKWETKRWGQIPADFGRKQH